MKVKYEDVLLTKNMSLVKLFTMKKRVSSQVFFFSLINHYTFIMIYFVCFSKQDWILFSYLIGFKF
jgi:hypothetical protein